MIATIPTSFTELQNSIILDIVQACVAFFTIAVGLAAVYAIGRAINQWVRGIDGGSNPHSGGYSEERDGWTVEFNGDGEEVGRHSHSAESGSMEAWESGQGSLADFAPGPDAAESGSLEAWNSGEGSIVDFSPLGDGEDRQRA